MDKNISVSVVYALPDRSYIHNLSVPQGATVRQVLALCSDLPGFSVLANQDVAVGIFGEVVSMDYRVKDQDRVEIYRPLICDPKMARRERVVRKKSKKR